MIREKSITNIDSSDVKEMITRYADLKTHETDINSEIKSISDLFKGTTDDVLTRNQPYTINHEGRSFCFKIERTTRTTLDTNAVKDMFKRIDIDISPYQKTSSVQSFSVAEQKLFE